MKPGEPVLVSNPWHDHHGKLGIVVRVGRTESSLVNGKPLTTYDVMVEGEIIRAVWTNFHPAEEQIETR